MPELALGLWGLYFLLTLGLRALLQKRRTGEPGLRLMRAPAFTLQWIAEGMESLALGLGVAAAALADAVEPISDLDGSDGHIAGIALFGLGLLGVMVSQESMGRSWRLGQDDTERTDLITEGPFAIARNPIFSSLLLVQLGLSLLVPSPLAVAGIVLLIVSIELQVRAIEEPHLLRVHGEAYRAYGRRVGRFVPGLGRLR